MGLDMSLNRHIYIGANYEHNHVKGKIEISIKEKPIKINFNKVVYIVEEFAYWRKSNQIHNWFVENVQNGIDDCKEYYVSKENIECLLKTCKEVLEDFNIDKSKGLLPTVSGFFFGGLEYGEHYISDIEYTIKVLQEALKEDNENSEFYYVSSW